MNASRPASPDPRIVREDDPEHDRLIARGWRIVSRSWGARLTLADGADVSALEAAPAAARRAGYAVRRPDAADLPALADLDERVGPDFPDTPASRHEPLPADLAARPGDGTWLAFGALGFELEPAWHALAPPPPA